MRLEVDTYRCIGAGRCTWVAPEVFEQDEDGIVVLLDATPPADLAGEIAEAVRMCPAEAILLAGAEEPG
jgi:ferredoxin